MKSCEQVTPAEKIDVTRLHMEREAKQQRISLESSQPTLSLPTRSVDVGFHGGKSSIIGKKKTTIVADLLNIQSQDAAHSSIAKFSFCSCHTISCGIFTIF